MTAQRKSQATRDWEQIMELQEQIGILRERILAAQTDAAAWERAYMRLWEKYTAAYLNSEGEK